MKVQPVSKIRSTQNDLYPRCTIQADQAANRPDGSPMTVERAEQFAKEFDSSFVVDLNRKDIPSFLYNKDGKLT